MILSSGLTCITVLFVFLNCICITSVSWFFNLAFLIISWIVSWLDYSWSTTTGTSLTLILVQPWIISHRLIASVSHLLVNYLIDPFRPSSLDYISSWDYHRITTTENISF